jgi:DNA-binding transcriptional ArsR family regulator
MNSWKALSSSIRQEIIIFLSNGEKYLSEIAEHLNKTPQTVDFHLNILQELGIVKGIERDGKKYYVLIDNEILKSFGPHGPRFGMHHHKPPHEIVLDIKDELNNRMDELERKMDLILKLLKEKK